MGDPLLEFIALDILKRPWAFKDQDDTITTRELTLDQIARITIPLAAKIRSETKVLVSKQDVQIALDDLVKEGKVSKWGRGTVVLYYLSTK